MYYAEMFHWSFSEAGKLRLVNTGFHLSIILYPSLPLSYVLVTMRAALEYVRGPDVEQYMTKKSSVGVTV